MKSVEEQVEKAYSDAFNKRISGDHQLFLDDEYKTIRHAGGGLRDKLTKLVEEGNEVKCRWVATAVRGHHDIYIFYRKTLEGKNQ